jgi:hypothetical protein
LDISKKLREIKQTIRGMGTRPAIIDAVDLLCDLVEELADNVHVPVPDVQTKVEDVPTDPEVSGPKVSESLGKKARKANKATTSKAKKTTKV